MGQTCVNPMWRIGGRDGPVVLVAQYRLCSRPSDQPGRWSQAIAP
jgi:hypothetical protein